MAIRKITVGTKLFIDTDVDPRVAPGIVAPPGSFATNSVPSSGRLYYKFGTGDTAWRIVDFERHLAEEFFGQNIISHTAIDTAPTNGPNTNLTFYSETINSDTDDQVVSMRTQIMGIQTALTGAAPEGAIGDCFLIEKTVLAHYVSTANGGPSLFLSPPVTDKAIYMDAAGGVGMTNDSQMNFDFTAPSATSVRVRFWNGVDNGGGDAGRTIRWVSRITTSAIRLTPDSLGFDF